MFPGFGIPMRAFRFLVLTLVLGFPMVFVIAWVFELGSGGHQVNEENDSASNTAFIWRRKLVFGLAVALPTALFGIAALVFYFGAWRGDVEQILASIKWSVNTRTN